MAYLPDDILFMVCTQLWNQRDFNTLFKCVCAGKQLATLAVTYLYRIQGVTFLPIYDMKAPEHELISAKHAALWRTIILSSLGKTLYPYSRYIRTLDLGALGLLLRNGSWDSKKGFFQGELAQFKVVDRNCELDKVEIINRIGEVITKETPLLEELTGEVHGGVLSRWIPRLPLLTQLEPWHGGTIEGNGNLIRLHCPLFKRVNFSRRIHLDPESVIFDPSLVAFINELRPQSLESFDMFDCLNVGIEVFQALSCHGESLVELDLDKLSSRTIPKLSLLKGCTNLVSLSLTGEEMDTDDLEILFNDAFPETVTWLKECKKLRILAFTELFSDATLVTPILLDNSIQLTSFKYESSRMFDTDSFLRALSNQTSLQHLYLTGRRKAYPLRVGDCIKDSDCLLQSLRDLVNLTHLALGEISNFFDDKYIVQIARSLPKLEAWSTLAYQLTDKIWGEVASLRSLRRLEIDAVTNFTADGILDFVEKLRPGNEGLVLSVFNQSSDMDFSPVTRELIKEAIAKKVGGRFEYRLNFDCYTIPSDSDSNEWL